jgi:hypothetical protein
MKFPITRETLQELTAEKALKERAEEEIEKKLNELVEEVCITFQSGIKFALKEKKFVWRNMEKIRRLALPPGYIPPQGTPSKYNLDLYLPTFIEKLKEKFIDCDIIIDPFLQQYIIIDWS